MSGSANTQFALAVHALTLLAAHPDGNRNSELLAGSAGSNPVHVRRVLGALRRAGLVDSRPGPAGGWVLTVDPAAVTLRDVFEAINGEDRVLGLHSAAPDCPAGQRIQAELGRIERSAAQALAESLEHTTLADVLATTGADAFALGPPA